MTLADRADEGLAAVEATVVSDPSDYETFVAVFARTYKHGGDPAALVDLYSDFQEYTATHPNAGSLKVANALGVKRSHIRKWMDDGAVPYVVQGLQTAETNSWIPMAIEGQQFAAMNRLIAWVFSSGSINGSKWNVQFVVDDDQRRELLEQHLNTIGCGTIEPDLPGTGLSGTVLGATPDGSVLGRVLHALGTPVGDQKHTGELSLPAYLDDAPPHIGRGFLQTYLRNRQRDRDRDKPWLSFGEDRPASYQRELVALIQTVTGESASISGMDIHVSADAVRALGLA